MKMKRTTNPVEQLTQVNELYKDSDRWTQDRFKGRNGNKVCYCIGGALGAVSTKVYEVSEVAAYPFVLKAISAITHRPIKYIDTMFEWNDSKHRTIQQIRQVVSMALEFAKKAAKAA